MNYFEEIICFFLGLDHMQTDGTNWPLLAVCLSFYSKGTCRSGYRLGSSGMVAVCRCLLCEHLQELTNGVKELWNL